MRHGHCNDYKYNPQSFETVRLDETDGVPLKRKQMPSCSAYEGRTVLARWKTFDEERMMSRPKHCVVRDSEGVPGTFGSLPLPDETAAGAHVTVDIGGGQLGLKVPTSALVEREDGTFFFPGRFAELAEVERSHGASVAADSRRSPLVVPVIEEELQVGRRRVETGGVRVSKKVHEREQLVDELLLKEEVEVERVPINQVVDGPVEVRHEGDVMIVPVMEEVLIVEKRLVLKEELHIKKRRVEERNPQRVTLRSEEVSVDSFGGQEQREEDNRGQPRSAASTE